MTIFLKKINRWSCESEVCLTFIKLKGLSIYISLWVTSATANQTQIDKSKELKHIYKLVSHITHCQLILGLSLIWAYIDDLFVYNPIYIKIQRGIRASTHSWFANVHIRLISIRLIVCTCWALLAARLWGNLLEMWKWALSHIYEIKVLEYVYKLVNQFTHCQLVLGWKLIWAIELICMTRLFTTQFMQKFNINTYLL